MRVEGKGRSGRLEKRWLDVIESDMKKAGVSADDIELSGSRR